MIPSEIDPHQTIYRFLNFFDLFNVVKDKKIRFTKLHKLDDKNEGVAKILRSFELLPVFRTGLEHLKNIEYPIIKHTTYVSCWTKVPDNIAMWTLYSPNKSAIRIKTTVSKLYTAINNYKKNYSNKIYKIEDFQPNQVDVFGMVYEDLRKVKNDIESKVEMGVMDVPEATGKSKAEMLRAGSKAMREYLKNLILEDDNLKDKNYSHEEEVRGQLIFEPTTEDAYEYMHSSECDFSRFPNFIFPIVNDDFIEELCFDPRCEPYKIEVFKKIIDPDEELNIVNSDAFGIVL